VNFPPLQLLDPKLRKDLGRYLFQCGLAAVAILIVILLEQALFNRQGLGQPVVIAAIGSTAFVLFIMPGSRPAKPRNVLGGHFAALVIGGLLTLGSGPDSIEALTNGIDWEFALRGAAAVGLTLFVMAGTNTEHPPAAGTALAMVVQQFDWNLVFFLSTSVAVLFLIYRTMRSRLKDLY
jgi:CBS-domain-containing membrane protein